jgi:hypothetical protein
LQRTVDALDAIMQIARALGGETNLDLILGLVAKRGRALVAARALALEHEHAGEMVIAAGPASCPTAWSAGESISGTAWPARRLRSRGRCASRTSPTAPGPSATGSDASASRPRPGWWSR